MEYLGWAAVGIAVIGIVSLIRLWFSDAGFDVLAVRVPNDGFRGKRVVVVGASTGIGHALALRLAKDGAQLAVCSRNLSKLEALARECEAAGSPKTVALELDVLDLPSHEGFAESTAKVLGGPIDVLVNNAGRSQRSLAETTELKVTRQMMELNFFGNISIAKAFLPAMLKRRDGHIVVTSSVAGKVGAPCSSSYSATKHAVQGYYNALRNEVAYRGVDITLVCPGPVESDITLHSFTSEAGVKASEVGFAPDKSKRMTSERCAELMARAIHHRKLYEIWVSPQPVLLFTVLSQFLPTFAAYIGATKVGPARTIALMGGKPGYESVQNVFSMLFGAEAKPKDE